MCENEALAQMAPSATSTARASILSRSVASQIGGSWPGRPLGGAEALDVAADVGQRLAGRQPEAVHRRGVADAEPEPEATAADLGEVAGGDRHLGRVAVVDRLDARPERDPRRDVGERAAQRQVAVDARAGQPGEAPPVGLGGELEDRRRASSAPRSRTGLAAAHPSGRDRRRSREQPFAPERHRF